MIKDLYQVLHRRIAVTGHVSVGDRFHVGPRSRIWAPTNLQIEHDVYIGKNCTIEVDGLIGAGTLIANNVGIVGRRDHDLRQIGVAIRLSRWVGDDGSQHLRTAVMIEGDVWIGFGAVILAPVKIGRGAVVAAGSVVHKDVPPYAVVAGNPASVIGERFTPEEVRIHEQNMTEGADPVWSSKA